MPRPEEFSTGTKPCPNCGATVYGFSLTVQALTNQWGVCPKCYCVIEKEKKDA